MAEDMKKPEWRIIEEKSGRTERLRIPGGWLYRTVVWEDKPPTLGGFPGKFALAVAMVFVPEEKKP